MSPEAVAWVGIGWRPRHALSLLKRRPALGFIEVHSENFFGEGGAARKNLLLARAEWPVSLHGVGLSLGSTLGLDPGHLEQLASLVAAVQPVRVSDHASFARVRPASGGVHHAADLLPTAFSRSMLQVMGANIQRVQERLGQRLWVENLSACLRSRADDMSEPEFFNALTRETGCGLLLDVNNLVVNAKNAGSADPVGAACAWVDALAPGIVGEIHLAGHDASGLLVIDDHGSAVPESVWRVFAHALGRLGPIPALIEWDHRVPPLDTLLGQAAIAARHVQAALDAPHRSPKAEPMASARMGVASQAAVEQEARRQQALVSHVFQPSGTAPACNPEVEDGWAGLAGTSRQVGPEASLAEGLAAYRRNGLASARRAAAQAYPVLGWCLGEEALAVLAHRLWQQQPPVCGDLNQWGSDLPALVACSPETGAWPWMADLARLEWAIHQAGATADAGRLTPEVALSPLSDSDPAALQLVLRPGTQALASVWPVFSIWRLHQALAAPKSADAVDQEPQVEPSADPTPDLQTLASELANLLALASPECAVVWRERGAVRVDVLSPDECNFMQAVARGVHLEAALRAHPQLDFQAWLLRAWTEGWLLAVTAEADGSRESSNSLAMDGTAPHLP